MQPTLKDRAEAKLIGLGVTIGPIEGEGESLVFHILPDNNKLVAEAKEQLETELNAYVELAEMGGMNVVIVEAKEADEDEEEETTEPAVVEKEGPVLESNEYVLKGFKDSEDVIVEFYEMNEDGSTKPGTTVESMIQVSIERLTLLNSRFTNDYTKNAIHHLQEALAQLNERTRDRVARGVEGQHKA